MLQKKKKKKKNKKKKKKKKKKKTKTLFNLPNLRAWGSVVVKALCY
jgi:hypothetical protein